MTLRFIGFAAALAACAVGFTACPSPKSDAPKPNYGSVTYGTTTYQLSGSQLLTGGTFAFDLADDDGGSNVVDILSRKTPNAAGYISLGDSTQVSFSDGNGYHTFRKPGQKIAVNFTNSKTTFSFTDLVEIDNFGNELATGKKLSGAVSTK